MLFNITQIHAGIIPALFVFLLWSLPGAIAMYAFSLGVSRISETLPGPVYALLSGLNAATVGIIALAGVQLSRKAITDKLTRLLVLFGGCAGMCYNALWYFPLLLVFGGLLTFVWDLYGRSWFVRLKSWNRRQPSPVQEGEFTSNNAIIMVDRGTESGLHENEGPQQRYGNPVQENNATEITTSGSNRPPSVARTSGFDISAHRVPVKIGLTVIALFFAAFTVLMSLRGALHPVPILFALYNNMFLAGTIIFGGGPVVVPLLRNYVVDPGWVSPRDFLLGLAVIQAMPGPNFNFAVYLGSLVVASNSNFPSAIGAILGYLGIFLPGLWLSVGFQSVFQSLRKRREVSSVLRGMNAAAVGFVFTAVYRLWEIGYLSANESRGASLGKEPWWLVIAASTFTAVEWFSAPPPLAIVAGGAAGIAWWGAVGRRLNV